MLIYNLEQGTPAWLAVRLGVPTTSNFGKIITPDGKPSGQADDYLNELIGQLLTGKAEETYKSQAMQRGNELEPHAVAYYEYWRQTLTKKIGFVTTRDGRIGCSPDRLVKGGKGLLEIKCPMYKTHVKNLRAEAIDKQYYPQVQGQLLLTRREWCDWMSYHPDMPASIVRVERDEEYLEKLKHELNAFLEEQDRVIAMLKSRGCPFAIEVKPREIGRVEGI